MTPTNLVVMLTLANLGYVMADVAADGEPWRLALVSARGRSHARSLQASWYGWRTTRKSTVGDASRR